MDNIKLNNFENIIFPKREAVAGTSGSVNLYIARQLERDGLLWCTNMGKHTTVHDCIDGDHLTEKVNAVTLEEIINREKIERIDFLKIDVEGAEYEILFNTSGSIFDRIRLIALELHAIKQRNENDLKIFLEKNGFVAIIAPPYIYAKREFDQ